MMQRAQLEKLATAAELFFQRELAKLSEIESRRRALKTQVEERRRAAIVLIEAGAADLCPADLLAAANARAASRRIIQILEGRLAALEKPRTFQKDLVRKALAKKNVIGSLIDKDESDARQRKWA